MCAAAVKHQEKNQDIVSNDVFIANVSKLLKGAQEEKCKIFMVLCETGDEHGKSTIRLDEVILVCRL